MSNRAEPVPASRPVLPRPWAQSRGRSVEKLITTADLASLLAVPRHVINWHCERAGRLGRDSLFFGVFKDGDGQWMVPKRVAMRVCSTYLLQHYSVAQVAELVGFSQKWIRRLITVVPHSMDIDAGRPHDRIGARYFFESHLRIPWSEVARIAGWPAVAQRRQSATIDEHDDGASPQEATLNDDDDA